MSPSMTIKLLLQVLCILCIGSQSVVAQLDSVDKSCYFNTTTPYRYYSTKTLYEDARGGETVQQETIPDCEPSLFYLFARHGTRFPSSKWTKKMMDLLPELKRKIMENSEKAAQNICQRDLQRILSWNLRVTKNQAGQLASPGYDEMKSIAKRFQMKYPSLLKREYSESDFHILHTHSFRTEESADGFVDGLFNITTQNVKMEVSSEDKATLLRFYKLCSKYVKEVDDVDVEEQEKFYKSDVFTAMVRNVTNRLGLSDYDITLDHIHVMHQMCAFDHDIYGDAPWCAAFTEADLKILEYGEDLEYYYENGYGSPNVAQDQTCYLMKDVVKHLRDGEQSSRFHPKAALRFGHSGSFQPFLAKLGLFKQDVKLRADNMADQASRKWRTSLIAPFAANFAFVVYRCSGQTKVKTFLNEDPIALPGCSDPVCELHTALSAIEPFANTCDFDEICENNFSHSAKLVSTWQYIFILLLAFTLL